MMKYVPNIPKGIQVVKNDLACSFDWYGQIRFPKSKKKRIRNKWKKRKSNYGNIKRDRMFQIGDVVYVSNRVYEILKEL